MNFLPAAQIKERRFKLDLTLTPAQQHIDDNLKRFTLVRAGRKFGKTVYARKKMLDWMGPANACVWYIAPTYKQAKLISWSEFKRMIPAEALAKRPNDNDLVIQFKNGSEGYFMGSDDTDTLRGPKPTGIILEEAAYHKREAWHDVLRPNLLVHRAPALFITSPNGFNWFKDLEDEAKAQIARGSNEWATFHYSVYDNPYIDKEEIESARLACDNPAIWRQEYMAEYESSVGRVFNSYQDTERHVRKVVLPAGTFTAYRGIDWGMRDNTGCLWAIVQNRKLCIYREYAENGLSAPSQAQIIQNQTTPKEKTERNIIGHDASRQDVAMQGLTVQWHFSNAGITPLRTSSRKKDQSRAMIQTLLQEDRLVIDTECRKLRKQLLSYEWKDTAMEKPEDGNDDLVDALHYLVELLQYDLMLDRKVEEPKTLEQIYAEIRADKAAQAIRKYDLVQKKEEQALDFDNSPAGYL